MAKLRDLLQFRSLKNLELVTGTDCLDVNVGTVTVMEVPDVIQWLRGEDFLITSLYSIGDDEEKQCCLLYDLMETRSACLAVKTGKYAHRISDKMISIANKNHFPLLRIPYEMTYIDIIMDAMNVIMIESNRKEMLGKYISDIIFHPSSNERMLQEEGRLLKVDIEKDCFQSLILEFDTDDAQEGNVSRMIRFAVDRLANFTESLSKELFCGSFKLEKGMLLFLYSREEAILEQYLPFVLTEMRVILDSLSIPCDWKVGIGTARKNAVGIRRSYEEAVQAMELGKILEPLKKTYQFKDLELYSSLREILQHKQESLFSSILGKLKNQELVDTLIIYFECNGNMDETASCMYTHKNTIKYRLNKIKELTGLDVKNQEDNFKLYFMVLEKKLCGR
ncbi:PucR family transcriptional regulator [Faecalicatena contorta]|uniref:PucR family transcriptional regulator n=1 Tax=Faecalicatena contorta TaxID=39482 RepID=UPI001899E793|nr:PucR family transcriptional regulator [Faecalicatena contorta]